MADEISKKIFTYEIDNKKINEWQKLLVHGHIQILHAGAQDGRLLLWAEVDARVDAADQHQEIFLAVTGGAVPEGGVHGATLQCRGRMLHIYFKPQEVNDG